MYKILLCITLILFLLCFYGEGFAAPPKRVKSPLVPPIVTDIPSNIACGALPPVYMAKYGNNKCLACTTDAKMTTNAESKYNGKPIYCMVTPIQTGPKK